ncbi:hypothetical protein [Belnapia rosea]|uniref:Uncharacterized protein n=1 Tax=Belnapia rosea TaxID=938405 RepID=A0A1G6Q062_9PROT|nr:hypothetical protein [Belnapia rosea]SDC85027.1 hypothetical protein SAMN04487779_1002562 [Belnapia rosea]
MIRILTVADSTMPKGASNYPEANFRAARVGAVPDRLVQPKVKPRNLRVDNRPEFAARLPNHSAYLIGLAKTDRRPGIYLKPKKDRTATTTTTRPTM